MLEASIDPSKARAAGSRPPMMDKYTFLPFLACAYATILSPLMLFFLHPPPYTIESIMEVNVENKIFWPAIAAFSLILAVRDRSRLTKITWPPPIVVLMVYLALAGMSVVWAFRPSLSFVRFAQEAMVISSIILPAMLAPRTTDLMAGLFLCFATASILNLVFVFTAPPVIAEYGSVEVAIGYPGYFTGKNLLGECAVIALFLALHELLYAGLRRALAIIVFVIAILLLIWSNSKTALGFAIVIPVLAGLTLVSSRATRLSPAIILLSIPVCYVVASTLFNLDSSRISYILYGDSTLTGRTVIWDFVKYEIGRNPLLGWGYQSFWLVGPDAPSVVEAPGWVKNMPNAHNGYYDTMVELGYVGLATLLVFIIATLHGVGRMAQRDLARAWVVLSLLLFIIMFNFLESLWMRAFDMLWVVFLILVAEVGRYWQPARVAARAGDPAPSKPRSPSHRGRGLRQGY